MFEEQDEDRLDPKWTDRTVFFQLDWEVSGGKGSVKGGKEEKKRVRR